MVSKKKDTSWIASGLRAGVGALEVEAVAGAPTTGVVDVDGKASSILGGSTLSVVGLLGWAAAVLNSLDTRDSGVGGSEVVL